MQQKQAIRFCNSKTATYTCTAAIMNPIIHNLLVFVQIRFTSAARQLQLFTPDVNKTKSPMSA
jgi:hypothetical protein